MPSSNFRHVSGCTSKRSKKTFQKLKEITYRVHFRRIMNMPSHAVRGAPAVRAEGCPQALSQRRAALGPSAQSFSLRSSFQRGLALGERRWRGWSVSGTMRTRRPGRVATAPGLGYQDTSTTLPHRRACTGQRSRHF